MNDSAVSKINSNMARVADQVAGLCLRIGNLLPCASLLRGGSWYAVAKRLIYGLGESGAVRSFRQAGSAGYIRISNKLAGKIGYLAALCRSAARR